jgi:methylated-DNA-[protein]-cysteine S-methyltransferase
MNPTIVRYSTIVSPIGRLLLTSNGSALTGLYMEPHTGGPEPGPAWVRDDGATRAAAEQLTAYFEGGLQQFNLPLELRGTEFQRNVWTMLRAIPFGTTLTYTEVAERAGAPGAVRAVGAAIGRNPVSIVVPCHRVIGSNGKLTGYAGGLDRKRWLLAHEGSAGFFQGMAS